MKSVAELSNRWKALSRQIAEPMAMRAGSLCQQRPRRKAKDGSLRTRGPYLLYTRKEKAKTISRIVPEAAQSALRQTVDNFHRFLAVTREMRQIGAQLAELTGGELKKNSRR